MSGTITKNWAVSDANPILHEICTRLREPQNIDKLMNKSLIARPTANFQEDWKRRMHQSNGMYATIPNDSGLSMNPKPVKISQTYIEKTLIKDKMAPRVPIHKMDTINQNITERLMSTEAQKRVPEQQWKNKKVMLPILNMRDKEKTLHTSEVLTKDTIKKQWTSYKGKLKARDV